MRIKYGHFALLPQTCDICGRRFIWERYSKRFREIGIGHDSFSFPVCRSCTDERRLSFTGLIKPKQKPERKAERWLYKDGEYRCSGCYFSPKIVLHPLAEHYYFCPACGAEMSAEPEKTT